MSEHKHTKGPWAVFNDHPDELTAKSLSYIRPVDSAGLYSMDIASIYGCTEPEQHHNAKLIAAAPELLEALIDLGDWLAYGLNKAAGAEPTAEDHAACERVAAKARAAVDKALGR